MRKVKQENTPAVTRTRISCLGNGRFILLNYGGIDAKIPQRIFILILYIDLNEDEHLSIH